MKHLDLTPAEVRVLRDSLYKEMSRIEAQYEQAPSRNIKQRLAGDRHRLAVILYKLENQQPTKRTN